MKARRILSLFLLAACTAIVAGAGPAHANGWPSSVVGSWKIEANRSALTLNIASQAAGKGCVAIAGTITDPAQARTDNVQGFYCPLSGRVSFLRKNAQTNATFQTYTGNVSQAGSPLYMGGTFVQEDACCGSLGEYGFLGQQGQT